jgi:hypothetical protein
VAELGADDWRARSAACDALALMAGNAAASPAPGAPALADADVTARLTGLLADSNAWVRCRAAGALGALRPRDPAAAAALAGAVTDSDAWVRVAALGAIDKVTQDPRALLDAAGAALRVPSTAFAQGGMAMALIRTTGAADRTLAPALAFWLENPGEGGGSERLNEAMELLVKLDPEGGTAVPALARVAAGGYAYDRLRGNPRKAAIALLGRLGSKSAGAVPVLKAIAEQADDKEAALRDAARAALEKIAPP